MRLFDLILATAEETEAVDSAGGLGVGALALMVTVVVVLGWMGWLYVNSRRTRAASQEPAPPNLATPISDDELENTHLTNVLRAALLGSALLAIALPWYAFNEPGRQEAAAESISELDVEEGTHWFSHDGFACADCHGPTGGGGSALTTEERSGVSTAWSVPALDDVFFRYSVEEVRYWITYGRAGTPMPSNGLEGGGAMTVQEIDQTIAYIESIQVSQADAYARSEPAVARALQTIEGGAVATQSLINRQLADIEEVNTAPSKMSVIGTFPDEVKDLFQAPGVCTSESAALVNTTCSNPGADSDRDGVSDEAEVRLTDIAAASMQTITVIVQPTVEPGQAQIYVAEPNPAYALQFDPLVAFSNEDASTHEPMADLDAADHLLELLETDVLVLSVTAEGTDAFLEKLLPGLAFLEDSLANEPWAIDFDAVASNMGVSTDDATLAVGLFNAYCARCHTGGYSAGATFEQGAGSGAWGPSLLDGRATIQFPDMDSHVKFVVTGSENAEGYGINGIGTGRMPSFGSILSAEQIELIVMYERSI